MGTINHFITECKKLFGDDAQTTTNQSLSFGTPKSNTGRGYIVDKQLRLPLSNSSPMRNIPGLSYEKD